MSQSKQTEPQPYGTVTVGSLVIQNTPTIIDVAGEPLMSMERGKDGQILASIDVYTAQAEHVARLRRNAWAFGGEGYELDTNPKSLSLTGPDGKVLVRASVVDRVQLNIPHAVLYTPAGIPVLVSALGVTVGGQAWSGSPAGGASISNIGFVNFASVISLPR